MLRAPMGLGLTVKPFYVYVLTLKMNQSLSQNIRHINTTIKILWGPPKCGGPGHVPPVPPPKSGPAHNTTTSPLQELYFYQKECS